MERLATRGRKGGGGGSKSEQAINYVNKNRGVKMKWIST